MFGFLPTPAGSPVEMEPVPDFMVEEMEKMPASKRSQRRKRSWVGYCTRQGLCILIMGPTMRITLVVLLYCTLTRVPGTV